MVVCYVVHATYQYSTILCNGTNELHSLVQGIQITATTPTMNAVRLETSVIELELSNRIQRANRSKAKDEAEKLNTIPESVSKAAVLKVFIKAQVDLNLALGTIIKNPMFEEAESEFQHLASFQTRITLRNALQVCVFMCFVWFLAFNRPSS